MPQGPNPTTQQMFNSLADQIDLDAAAFADKADELSDIKAVIRQAAADYDAIWSK